jgi:hypothetical protein
MCLSLIPISAYTRTLSSSIDKQFSTAYIYYMGATRIWTQDFEFAKQALYHLSHTYTSHSFFFGVCGTGAWTQSLHIEPLQQPFFVMSVFHIGSHKLFAHPGFEPPSS